MRRRIEVLAADWEPLRRQHPGADVEELAAVALARGIDALLTGEGARDLDGAGRASIERLRSQVVHRAATLAYHRFDLVTRRGRLARAEQDERASHGHHVALAKDMVPPLKREASRLRAEVRRLESLARERGIDPASIGPSIDWERTVWVDDYVEPRFETEGDRRRDALAFFRRVGER
jgi:hypothetical protein